MDRAARIVAGKGKDMTREDIIRMAREAGFERIVGVYKDGTRMVEVPNPELLERFAALVAAAEREKLAHWMRSLGYATGQGKTTEDLLDHLGTQIAQGLEAEVLMEREACAKVCDGWATYGSPPAASCAKDIRARGNK